MDAISSVGIAKMLNKRSGVIWARPKIYKTSSKRRQKASLSLRTPQRANGKLTWHTVRATLLKRMTEVKLSTFESKVACEELPLSVLLARGWEEQVVRKFPSEDSEAHGCDLFKVPIRTCTWAEAFQSSEETILEREKQATKKKSSKQNDMDVPVAGPSGKEGTEEKKDERKKAQEAKRIAAQNVKIATSAAKCLGPLTQAELSLTKVIAKGDTVPEAEAEALKLCKESLVTVKAWIKAAKDAVSMQDQNKEKGEDAHEALQKLPCDAGEVKVLLEADHRGTKVSTRECSEAKG